MDEQASINTPEASSSTASINSVLQQGDKVNRENQDQHSLRDAVEDVRFSIRDGSITTESTEEERYEVLKDAVFTLATVDKSKL